MNVVDLEVGMMGVTVLVLVGSGPLADEDEDAELPEAPSTWGFPRGTTEGIEQKSGEKHEIIKGQILHIHI